MAAFSFYMMYKKLAYFVVIIFLAGDLSGQELKPNHIQVAILGMFHMGESSDYRKAEMDSPLTGKRQREIAEVVNKLAAFRPDKIFVENTPDTQEFWNQVFEQYKKGRLPAESSVLVNEIFQIGIKTAALNPRSKGGIPEKNRCLHGTNSKTKSLESDLLMTICYSKIYLQNVCLKNSLQIMKRGNL
jgi:hypothetical protein